MKQAQAIQSGYVSDIRENTVVLVVDNLIFGVDKTAFLENYSEETLLVGRQFILVEGTMFWNFSKWTAEEIQQVKEEAQKLSEYFLQNPWTSEDEQE